MEPALKTVQNILPKLDATIIEFLSEWLVTFLMPAKHVLDTRAPHLYFMFLEYWFRELLGRPFWAKLVLRRFSGPRIGSVGVSSFVDDFVSCCGKWGAYRLLLEPTWSFFSVQRLHGFRQIVYHTVWHCMSSNCKLVFQAIYCWGPQKRTGEGPVQSPLGRHHHKPGKQQRHTKQNQTTHKTKQQNQNKPKPDTQEWLAPSSLVDSCRWWQHCVITS